MVLCLDGSGSIGFNDYKKVQTFAKDFIEEFSNQGKSFNGEEGLKIGGTFVVLISLSLVCLSRFVF